MRDRIRARLAGEPDSAMEIIFGFSFLEKNC